ncbi:aminodeoxychorismate synthase [Malassezia equina]|uniref:Aminodeoxychorismate synthase n=1 Tax=Malassezia equina TaxID=1381935 RepID=A0AAF0E9Y4_9BASI|nr:aminodeoxychorismate synthase [Malassezia equina]
MSSNNNLQSQAHEFASEMAQKVGNAAEQAQGHVDNAAKDSHSAVSDAAKKAENAVPEAKDSGHGIVAQGQEYLNQASKYVQEQSQKLFNSEGSAASATSDGTSTLGHIGEQAQKYASDALNSVSKAFSSASDKASEGADKVVGNESTVDKARNAAGDALGKAQDAVKNQTSSMIRLEEEDRQLREEWDEGVRQLQTAFQGNGLGAAGAIGQCVSYELLNNRVTVIPHTHEALEAEEFHSNFLPYVDALILLVVNEKSLPDYISVTARSLLDNGNSASLLDPQSNMSIMSHSDFVLTYGMDGCLQLSLDGTQSLQHVDMGDHEQLWDWLDEVQRTIQSQTENMSPNKGTTFRTGFLGIWSYEMKDESLGLKKISPEIYEGCSNTLVNRMEFPAAQWAFCNKALCFDHASMTWTAYALVNGDGQAAGPLGQLEQLGAEIGMQACDAERWFSEAEAAILETSNLPTSLTQGTTLSLRPLDDGATYMEKVEESRKLIGKGESYEICLTTQFEGTVPGLNGYEEYFLMYCHLRRKNPAPFGAYLELLPLYGKPQAILSTSPERFLTVSDNGNVEMRPIKGTKVRPGWGAGEEDWFSKAADPKMKAFMEEEDCRRKMQLHKDPKERAENLMIADLIRADLQSVCYPGSVTVPRLIAIETYETVHQLVTSVTGTLRPGIGCVEATKRCFPPGSMTGAPKRRSVELIETLERPTTLPGPSSRRRAMYSGALGFIGVDGASNLSVIIRTVTVQANDVTVGAGGAITFLSSPEGEWDEVLTNEHPFDDFAEDDVLAVQKPSRLSGNEKLGQKMKSYLGTIAVGTRIGLCRWFTLFIVTNGDVEEDDRDADKYDPLVNILEDESLPIRINKVSSSGVQLADGQEYPPTCIFLDGRAFVWNVPPIDKMQAMPNGHGWEAWTNDIWSLFELTTPRPEILILGTGDVVLPVPARIKTYLNSLGIQLDVQSTSK